MGIDLELLCKDVRELTAETGKFIVEERQQFKGNTVEEKSAHNYVTYVDKTAEERIVERLSQLLPYAGIIAEEGTTETVKAEYMWIIDPLDGTTNYIHGIPCYAISIALMKGDEIVLGVVHELNLDECFYTRKGAPAYMNNKEIKVSKEGNYDRSLFATGFPYHDYDKLDDYLALFKHFLKSTSGVRRFGSAAVDLVYVASGRCEGFYEYGLNPWDVAAGALIVQQAGGTVTDFTGGNKYIFGSEILATNSLVHQLSLEAVEEYFY